MLDVSVGPDHTSDVADNEYCENILWKCEISLLTSKCFSGAFIDFVFQEFYFYWLLIKSFWDNV